MEQRIHDNNSHSKFCADVVTELLGIRHWAENPDSSFLWLQPEWQALGAGDLSKSFRLDYCRLN